MRTPMLLVTAMRQMKNPNEPDSHQDGTEKNKDDVKLIPLRFEEVKVNSWVLVLYEQEKFLGRCLGKAGGKFQVQCLSLPYGIGKAQPFENENDAVYYNEVYKSPVTPWIPKYDDDGNRSRKTLYKY